VLAGEGLQRRSLAGSKVSQVETVSRTDSEDGQDLRRTAQSLTTIEPPKGGLVRKRSGWRAAAGTFQLGKPSRWPQLYGYGYRKGYRCRQVQIDAK
jgi:hypothetical protein